MNIDESVYWDVYSNVVDEVVKGGNEGLDSDVDDEVGSSDNEVFELEVGDEIVSVNFSSVYEGVKGVKGEVSVGVGISECWFVDGDISSGNIIHDGIKFGFYDGYVLVYSHSYFDSFSVDKYIVWYLNESLE